MIYTVNCVGYENGCGDNDNEVGNEDVWKW